MSTSKSGGCGCGSAGCDCGTGTCTDESFKRPRFFAGQLLTEDDLQAMMDYVVGKNRLHNRYLFGEGVVCGLNVTCHPCGGGTVMVAPGFALDCCGNDLLLPCPEEVDIRALLRDLRKRQLPGYDCGDPCEKTEDHRRYGLYLTYRETQADPVAPYNSGDPCGQQGCEPTRTCEGFGFELRCECTRTRQADLYARIIACIGDLRSATSAIQRAILLYAAARGMEALNAAPAAGEEPRSIAALLRVWLLGRLEQAGSRTRCDLYERVKAVRLTPAEPDPRGFESGREVEAAPWLELVSVLLEYFIDCVCLALNPPCGACDDTGLLIACVELDGCEVVDICNMSRRYVLSPAAMRYWLPVNLIGGLLSGFCCDLDLASLLRVGRREVPPPPPKQVRVPVPPDDPSVGASAQPINDDATPSAAATTPTPPTPPTPSTPPAAESGWAVLQRIGIRPEDAAAAAEFSTSLADLALRVGGVDTGALRGRAVAAAGHLAQRLQPFAGLMVDAPAVRETMTAMVKQEVAAGREAVIADLRQEVGSSAAAAVGTLGTTVTAEVGARVTKDLTKMSGDVDRRVNAAVRKELAVTRLNGAVENLAVVKALRKDNEKLREELGKLSEAVKAIGAKP